MKVLSAGWGDVPDDVRFDIAVNTSRILSRLQCGEKHGYAYEDGRVPNIPDQQALQLGSIWHVGLERLAYHEPVSAIIADYEGERWVEDKYGKTQQEWFERALEAYAEYYQGDWPGGSILATEVPFWLVYHVPNTRLGRDEMSANVLVRGRLDRVTNWHGLAANGEIKTTAAGTKMDVFMGLRSAHPQDALYYLALRHAPRVLPNGATLPEQVFGSRYDIAQKYAVPKGRKKDRSDRPAALEAWKAKLFHEDGVDWTDARAERVAGKAISDYLGLAGIRHRNFGACNMYTQCPYFSVCHEGESLDSANFKDRDADYVDEACKAGL